MRKIIGAGFVLAWFIFLASNSFAQVSNSDGEMANNFTDVAMAEFKSVNDPALDYTAVSSRINDTAYKIAKVLSDNNIKGKEADMIMNKAALWYGQALEDLFKGKNFDEVIPAYSLKLDELLHKENLNLNVQMPIVSVASDDLQKMNTLFNNIVE